MVPDNHGWPMPCLDLVIIDNFICLPSGPYFHKCFLTNLHNQCFRHSTTSYSSSSSDDEEVRTRSNMAASSTSSGAATGGGASTSGGGAQLRTLQQRRARQLELLEKFEKRLRSHKPQVYCVIMMAGCKGGISFIKVALVLGAMFINFLGSCKLMLRSS